jgi:hypothetical protein
VDFREKLLLLASLLMLMYTVVASLLLLAFLLMWVSPLPLLASLLLPAFLIFLLASLLLWWFSCCFQTCFCLLLAGVIAVACFTAVAGVSSSVDNVHACVIPADPGNVLDNVLYNETN